MRKRMYAKPVLAHLGNFYQLTLANQMDALSEFFDYSRYAPPNC